jgi:hypothetical protein
VNDIRKTNSADGARLRPAETLEEFGGAANRASRAVLAGVGDDDVAAFECVVALD